MRTFFKSMVVACGLWACLLLSASGSSFPFGNVGEELEYELKWGFIQVGTGYLRILEPKEVDGELCYHVQLEVRTNGFADSVYKVRSRYESFISVEHLRPVRYMAFQQEGKTRRNGVVKFDWETRTATYQREGRDPLEPVDIEERTWDPLSVTYAFRRLLHFGNLEDPLYASDGRKCRNVQIQFKEKHRWEGAGFSCDAIRIMPDTKDLSGVFKKSKDSSITMWFSSDEHAYPLIIRSKVVVGSFEAVLKRVAYNLEAPQVLDQGDSGI
jgi:hypothetical protein